VHSKDQVGQLQDEYFKHPFNNNDAFFETYNPRDVMDEDDSDSEVVLMRMKLLLMELHLNQTTCINPKLMNFLDDLPEGLIDGNDTDADEEERVYDDALDMINYEGEPLQFNVYSESIEIKPVKEDEIMYNSSDGEDDSTNNDIHPDYWEEPNIDMEDAHDGESNQQWYDDFTEMNQH
jgi:hypothetical protein